MSNTNDAQALATGTPTQAMYASRAAASLPGADHERLFNAACYDLGRISEALGLDHDEGGAEPILSAIERLKKYGPGITLTGHQLIQALGFIAPDHEQEPEQLKGVIRLFMGDEEAHAGPGLYAVDPEYRDEGAVALFEPGKDAPGGGDESQGGLL